jgi:hypothetical protein
MKTKPVFHVRLVWGRRRASNGGPAPPLPALSATQTGQQDGVLSAESVSYPYFFVYHSEKESLEQPSRRNRDSRVEMPPLPTETI